eukprot:CAMPEP_0171922708 /NCGR_PEP_ID=MMETSP0993-20121228/21393_1 /TAXON_ID=483369 /ORGANISM="non described non described, Strain CCMP2098" /LENGTH=57 /DNA_ID=CAMNT_0012560457 /DNA_START=167 /DNA_END=336 /DNA_ORIENTATION=-
MTQPRHHAARVRRGGTKIRLGKRVVAPAPRGSTKIQRRKRAVTPAPRATTRVGWGPA